MKSTFFLLTLCFMVSLLYAQERIADIPLPAEHYQRLLPEDGSFGQWLQNLPLLPTGSPVLDYRGRVYKSAMDSAVGAVIDIDVSGRRMEQCMDILVRLYAEYVLDISQTEKLRLPLPGGYWLAWKDWAQGYRPKYRGVHVSLIRSHEADESERNYRRYLREIYAASNTQQFYHAYVPIATKDVQGGDVIIKKGKKRHAVMIVDLAADQSGRKIALIGHGDTPACQFYLLRFSKKSLWFPLDPDNVSLPLPIKRRMTWDGLRRFDRPKSGK